MELNRSIINKTHVYSFIMVSLCFILGYILLVSIDKIRPQDLTLEMLFKSVYTVFTQFGVLIFPIIVIYTFNSDYKEKNILFYELLNINQIQYFISKLLILIFWFSIHICILNLLVCILYRNFSKFLLMFYFFESVAIFYILIASLLAFLFSNFVAVFCLNLSLWVISIVVSTAIPQLSFVAYYDASNSLYSNLQKYLDTNNSSYLSIYDNLLYNTLVFIVVITIVYILKRRWKKNGI